MATLDGKLIEPKKIPMANIPIYQYESTFRTKEIIKKDRARFARAWNRYFKTYETRGGSTEEDAYNAWLSAAKSEYAGTVQSYNIAEVSK